MVKDINILNSFLFCYKKENNGKKYLEITDLILLKFWQYLLDIEQSILTFKIDVQYQEEFTMNLVVSGKNLHN